MEENDKEGQAGCHSAVGKEKMGSNLECGDDDNTPSLANDESVDDTLKQTNHLGKDKCDVCRGNHTEQMTITRKRKDEVSLLSGPSRSAFGRWRTVCSAS